MLSAHRYTKHCHAIAAFCLITTTLVTTFSIGIKNFFLIMAVLSVVASADWRNKLTLIMQNRVAVASILLFGLFVCGFFYSDTDWLSSSSTLKKYTRLLYLVIFIPLLSDEKLRMRVLHAFVISTVIAACIGIINSFTGLQLQHWLHHPLNPPAYPFAVISFNISFCTFLLAHLVRMQPKLIYKLALAIMVFFIVFVNRERTPYLLLFLLSVLFIYQIVPKKYFLMGSIVCFMVLLSCYFVSPHMKNGINLVWQEWQQYQHGKVNSATGLRLEFLKQSYRLWQQRPWFGYGTGSFRDRYLEVGYYNANGQRNEPQHYLSEPHNEYAHIPVQLGVVGLGAFLVYFATLLYSSCFLVPFERYLAQGLLLAFAVSCLFGSYLYYSHAGETFVILVACLFAGLPARCNVIAQVGGEHLQAPALMRRE